MTQPFVRKIKNKQRCGFRGKKLRYSVWRARYNKTFEMGHEAEVKQICADNNLKLDDYTSRESFNGEDRNKWELLVEELEEKGYRVRTKSPKEIWGDSGLMDQIVDDRIRRKSEGPNGNRLAEPENLVDKPENSNRS